MLNIMSSAKRTSFFPVGTRSIGLINDLGFDFISDLGRNVTVATGDPKESSCSASNDSINDQRFNAVAFLGIFSVAKIDFNSIRGLLFSSCLVSPDMFRPHEGSSVHRVKITIIEYEGIIC